MAPECSAKSFDSFLNWHYDFYLSKESKYLFRHFAKQRLFWLLRSAICIWHRAAPEPENHA